MNKVFFIVILLTCSLAQADLQEAKDYIAEKYRQIDENDDVNLDKASEKKDILYSVYVASFENGDQETVDYLCSEYDYNCDNQ